VVPFVSLIVVKKKPKRSFANKKGKIHNRKNYLSFPKFQSQKAMSFFVVPFSEILFGKGRVFLRGSICVSIRG
jgi:hypothetical protein